MRIGKGYVLLAAFFLTACAQTSTRIPGMSSQEVEAERDYQSQLATQEKLRQQEVHTENRLKMTERLLRVYKPVARAAVDLCADMHLQDKDNTCIYTVQLEETGPMNAFADGNVIHVTPAMMNFANTDNELTFILAHETSHNLMQHVDGMRQNAILGGLLGLVLDGVAASQGVDTQAGFTKIGMNAGVLSYSQDFEREADYVGLYLMARARIDYHKASDLWRRMSVRDSKAIYLSTTHPSNPERFVMMDKTVAEIDTKKRQRLALVPELKPQQQVADIKSIPAYPSKRGSRW